MRNKIRMMPPTGKPDPARLVPLVREYVKKTQPDLTECQSQLISQEKGSVVWLSSDSRARGLLGLNQSDSGRVGATAARKPKSKEGV